MAGSGKFAGTTRSGLDLLGVYLNDHLAGATGGSELARRAARSASGTAAGGVLQRFASDVEQDRLALLEVMATLNVPVRAYKVYAAWVGEKAARLKLNGYLLSRSPLSSLEELEMLRLGVEGKAAGWRTMRVLADKDTRLDADRLDELIVRAGRQADQLEELRVSAAAEIVSVGGSAAGVASGRAAQGMMSSIVTLTLMSLRPVLARSTAMARCWTSRATASS